MVVGHGKEGMASDGKRECLTLALAAYPGTGECRGVSWPCGPREGPRSIQMCGRQKRLGEVQGFPRAVAGQQSGSLY